MPALKDFIFREVALRKGILSADLLDQAAETQKEMEQFGIPRFVGAILVEKSLASPDQVAEIVAELDLLSIRCPDCQGFIPVKQCDRQGNLRCRSCRSPVSCPPGRISEDDLRAVKTARAARQAGPSPRHGGDFPPAGLEPLSKPHRKKGGKKEKGAAPPGAFSPKSREGGDPTPGSTGTAPSGKVFHSGHGELPTGSPELNRFQVRQLLGISSTGRLYRIRKAGELGAVKILDGDLCAGNPRFKQWIDFMQRVQDLPRSATLKPVQLSREGACHFLARPYVEGENATLRQLLAAGTPPGPRAVADLAVALLNSLCAFHSLKIVHGNLKPENVLLSEGAVRLSDPGVHLLLAGLSPDERILRLWDAERYHAPEVLQGSEPTTESDVHAAGRVLEELLEIQDAGKSRQQSDDGFLPRLRDVVQRMSAFDPVDRYATAREALRDLQRKDRPVALPPEPARTGAAARKPRGKKLRRIRVSRVAGPLILVAVLVALLLQGLTWVHTRAALASSGREGQIADELISRNVDALVLWTRTSGAEYAVAEARWKELVRLFEGTSWEPRILHRSRQALAHVPRPGQRRIREELLKVRSQAEDGLWVEALEGLLALENAPESEEAQEMAREVRRGLYEDLGMVFIPAGEVSIVKNGEKARLEVPPFLADAGLLSGEEKKSPEAREEGVPRNGTGEARVDISFKDAERLATSAGKRLPTEAEWDRLAAMPASEGDWEEFAASRIRDVPGTTFQWVVQQMPDAHSRAGYGVCRGGDRPGIPGTHPLRRRKKMGYPDVGVRFVRDVEPRSLTES